MVDGYWHGLKNFSMSFRQEGQGGIFMAKVPVYHICRHQTLQGAIIPLAWGNGHTGKSFGIYTDQGEEIIIEPSSLAKIRGHLHHPVKISGVVCQASDGQEFVRIEHIENTLPFPWMMG